MTKQQIREHYKKKRSEITKDQLNDITPFYFWKNDFIGNIKQNPILYLHINGNKIPIYGSSDIVKHTGDKKARVGLAVKFCNRGKEYRGYVFSKK